MLDLKLFSERVDELIFDKNLKAVEFAKLCGISKSTVYEYLSGRKMPTLKNLIKIAEFFNVSTDYLLGLEKDVYTKNFKSCISFSTRFNEVLKECSMSRYKLEQLTGISESVLYYWAKGKTVPTVESLLTVSSALNCSFDYLIGRE